MYTHVYIYICICYPLKDLPFSCVGKPDAANGQHGSSFQHKILVRMQKRLDARDFDVFY